LERLEPTEVAGIPGIGADGSATNTTFRYQGQAIAQENVRGSAVREYFTDEAGAIVKVCDPTCASPTTAYHVTYNGHDDALALWKINTDGTLQLANSYSYSPWDTPTTSTHNGHSDLGFRYLYVGQHGVQWDNALTLGSALHARPSEAFDTLPRRSTVHISADPARIARLESHQARPIPPHQLGRSAIQADPATRKPGTVRKA
jgi:hypothetical protein